jgi:hypothetical protein
MGHATWDHYHLMLRTLKTYNISLDCNPDFTATSGCEEYQRSMTFSSSPGVSQERHGCLLGTSMYG